MKKFLVLFIFFVITIFLYPIGIEASYSCSKEGHVIIFINGILNTKDEANNSRKELEDELVKYLTDKNFIVELGYNPSHYSGLGDAVQAVAQVLYTKVSNFDRDTILMQIHPKIKTQKILLVGHSQGSFYTNEIYKYLIKNGLPKESVGIYHIASPASEIANTLFPGDGDYLTSGNDNTIWMVRGLAEEYNSPYPLEPNILIPIQDNTKPDLWKGHSFIGEYLVGAPARIVRDIDRVLSKLKSNQDIGGGVEKGCFNPPKENITYNIKKGIFAITEPAAEGVVVAYKTGIIVRDTYGKSIDTVANAFGLGINKVSNLFKSDISNRNQTASASLVLDDNETETTNTHFETDVVIEDEVVKEELKVEEEVFVEETETPNLFEDEQDEIIIIEEPLPEDNTNEAPLFLVTPGFGGGGGGGTAPAAPVSSGSEAETEGDSAEEDTQVNAHLSIIEPGNFSINATTTITFIGTSTSESIISQDFSSATTTSDSEGNWQIILDLLQGTSTINFTATKDGYTSISETIEIFIDTEPPIINNFSSLDCNYSISLTKCLLPLTTLNFSWETSSSDVTEFKLYRDSSLVETLTATSTNETGLNQAVYSYELVAYDGINYATSSPIEIEIIDADKLIVINEIAWAGTEASSADEWIEIYNNSNQEISLSHFVLESDDGVPYLNLSNNVLGNSYYLIERSNEDTTNITGDLITVFSGLGGGSGLSNDGEKLNLFYVGYNATTTIDLTPDVSVCGGWCGGDSVENPISMERKNSSLDGSLSSSWGSNNTFTKNGTDVDGGIINGTPKSKNSINLKEIGYYCGSYTESFIEGGYYMPDSISCHYLSPSISDRRFGAIFKGEVGSSTSTNSHSLGLSIDKEEIDDYTGSNQGDKYFAAIWVSGSGSASSYTSDFMSFFETGSPAPPHLDYGVINWIYGVEP